MAYSTLSNSISCFVLLSVAVKSMPAVLTRLRELTSASSRIISIAVSIRAFDLVVRAFGPRRNHSISLRTRFDNDSCSFPCARACRPGLQKNAVVPLHAQQPFFIGAIEFDQLAGDVLQKIPIVTDHNCRERSRLQYAFEPSNAGQVQVVCGLIEEQESGKRTSPSTIARRLRHPPDKEAASASRAVKPARPRVSAIVD